MDISHEQKKYRFVLQNDDKSQIGYIEYRLGTGNEIYATSTHVNPEFEGRGLAAKLLDALAGYAEQQGLKIIPICSYVVRAFDKYPEKYAAVIKAP